MITRLRHLFLALTVLTILLGSAVYHQDNQLFGEVAREFRADGLSDEEYVLTLLDYVANFEVYSIAAGELPPEPGFNYSLYSTIPVNLIPPQVVLQDRLAYRGPCGARSRLLAALLNATGFEAHTIGLYDDDFRGVHTVIEVELEQGWVPVDATYGIAFFDDRGHLLTTEEVSANEAVFQEAIAQYPDYPEAYRYDHAQGFTPFYVMFTAGRVFGLWGWADSEATYDNLVNLFGQDFIDTDFGTPVFFDRPKLFLVYGPVAPLLILLVWEWWAWRRKKRLAVKTPDHAVHVDDALLSNAIERKEIHAQRKVS